MHASLRYKNATKISLQNFISLHLQLAWKALECMQLNFFHKVSEQMTSSYTIVMIIELGRNIDCSGDGYIASALYMRI